MLTPSQKRMKEKICAKEFKKSSLATSSSPLYFFLFFAGMHCVCSIDNERNLEPFSFLPTSVPCCSRRLAFSSHGPQREMPADWAACQSGRKYLERWKKVNY